MSIIILFLIYTQLPESPAWLLANQRPNEAFGIYRRIAKFNGTKYFHQLMLFHEKIDNKLINMNEMEMENKNETPTYNKNNKNSKWCLNLILPLKEIFFPKNIFLKTFVFIIIWSSLYLNYLGIR
jgi:hypothetical protein